MSGNFGVDQPPPGGSQGGGQYPSYPGGSGNGHPGSPLGSPPDHGESGPQGGGPGPGAYPGSPSHPGQGGYPGSTGHPGQGGYAGEPGYQGGPGYPGAGPGPYGPPPYPGGLPPYPGGPPPYPDGPPPYPSGPGGPPSSFYKGAQYGLPWSGPGSLASQWARLAARLIDGLCLIPVWIVIFVLLFASHAFGHSTTDAYGNATLTGANYGLVYLLLFLGIAIYVGYEALLTSRWGRTVGKRAMNMRIVTVANPQQTVSGGQAAARVAIMELGNFVPFVGGLFELVNELFCLFDSGRQCLHDKMVNTLVVRT